MARAILVAGAVAWLLGGTLGLALAAFGTGWLVTVLPPLAIGADALARAVGALSVGLLIVALAHAGALVGLRRGGAWGYGWAILLAGLLGFALATLGVAALTSAATQPASALAFIGSALAALGAGAAYGLAAVRLVIELRSRGRD